MARQRSVATIEAHIEQIDNNIESARKRQARVLEQIAELEAERSKYEAEIETAVERISSARAKGGHTRVHVNRGFPAATCEYCIEEGLA